jgi:anti-sigma factor RsiW
MSCEPYREKLEAYVDGETPEPELAAMEDHLRTCPDCATEAFRRMQMKRATRAAAMRFTPSLEFRQRIEKNIAPRRRPLAFLWNPAMAFALAVVLVAAVSAVVLVRHSAREQAVAELVDMHVAALASPNPVDVVSTDRHTVKPWFQGKLPFTFNLPELEGSEHKLAGGKLVYCRHGPGAQLIFALRKHELSVFLVQDGGGLAGTGLASESENGFSVESWGAAGLRYVIVSDAGPGDVHALGELLRSAQRQ